MSKITYGICNLHYAKKTIGADGAATFKTPVPIPGAREMSLDASGEPTTVFADNTKYVVIQSNQGYEGGVSVYGLPEEFCIDVLGMTKDAKGVLVENSGDVTAEVALLGEFESETAEKKRWVLYNCSVGRPGMAGKTKEESVEAQVFEIPVTASPLDGSENVKATITGTDADATFKDWFKSVYTPTVTPPAGS